VTIFNIDESGIHIRNKPDYVIKQKVCKNIHILISEPKTENVRVVVCRNDAGQFLPQVLIFNGINKKQELADGLHPGADVYMNRKSSYISTHLLSKSFREQCLKHDTSGKVVLLTDGSRAQCSFTLLLQNIVENNVLSFVYRVTVLATYTSRISVLLSP